MRMAVIYKNNLQAHQLAIELSEYLQDRGIDRCLLDSSKLTDTTTLSPVQLVVVLGGDGTLLRVARCFAGTGIPIMGVNLGTVGFLSSVEPEGLQPCMEAVLNGEYDIDARIMIDAEVIREDRALYRDTALNDVVLRTCTSHAILVGTGIDGKPHTSYWGDGVICATPTGSTAYSFSAGGPVIDTGLEALAITPICPHLSSARSLVVSASSLLTMSLDSDYSAGLAVDGLKEIPLLKGDRVQIGRSSMVTNLVCLHEVSCPERIQHLKGNLRVDLRRSLFDPPGERV